MVAALAPLGLTHVQFVLLASTWWLNEQGGEPNQLTVARHAGTDVKMTSQVLGKLEAKALLRREVDPADPRAKRLRVTPAGAKLPRQAIEVVERADTDFFAPAPNQAALVKALQRL